MTEIIQNRLVRKNITTNLQILNQKSCQMFLPTTETIILNAPHYVIDSGW